MIVFYFIISIKEKTTIKIIPNHLFEVYFYQNITMRNTLFTCCHPGLKQIPQYIVGDLTSQFYQI